jgi:hypothetical protein
MFTISAPPDKNSVYEFASRWTEQLVNANYDEAYAMLLHVENHPGRSWASSPQDLQSWINHYGSLTPVPGEPVFEVTSIEQAMGERWENDLDLEPPIERYPGYLGRLDWWLPLNGEWSDLQASFDLVKSGLRVAFVLVALRVP